jgi:hypothetical protein
LPFDPITALVLLLVRPALADTARSKPPPEAAPQKEMRDEAARLVNREARLADARDIHLSLWRLNKRAVDAVNVGVLSYRLHDWPTTAEFLTIYFDMVGPLDAPKIWVPPGDTWKNQYEQARVALEEARKRVGAIEVNVSDPGAEGSGSRALAKHSSMWMRIPLALPSPIAKRTANSYSVSCALTNSACAKRARSCAAGPAQRSAARKAVSGSAARTASAIVHPARPTSTAQDLEILHVVMVSASTAYARSRSATYPSARGAAIAAS